MRLLNLNQKFWLIVIIVLITGWVVYTFLFPIVLQAIYPRHYQEEVYSAAESRNLDPYLLFAIIKVESKFEEEAVSRQGAVGLMQVMPTTGAWAAQNIALSAFDYNDLFNPETNIELGAWYLDYLIEEFNGDLITALAAYNAGQGNVRKWLSNDTWDGNIDNLNQVPYKETENYVESVMVNYRRYKEIYAD